MNTRQRLTWSHHQEQRYTHLRPVHGNPAHKRLADAVPIADLVTAPRKRGAGSLMGKMMGLVQGRLKKLQ